MILEATATGKTVDEAKEAAMLELGASPESDVNFEIISLPQKKTFGLFGGCPAKVRVFMEVEDPKPEKKAKVAQKAKKVIDKKEKVKTVKPVNETKEEPKPSKESAVIDKESQNEVVNYLVAVLEKMGVENIQTEIVSDEDGTRISFDGDKLGVAIGRKGDTLDSLQHLVSLVANRKSKDYVRITLNPGGYRQKRMETLIGIAKKSAEQAQRTSRNVVLEPMNSYERRIVHNAIQEIEEVQSWSIGENDHRRVCIGSNKENKSIQKNDRRPRENQRYNRDRKDRFDRNERPSQKVESKKTREPLKDNANLPKYGVIKN